MAAATLPDDESCSNTLLIRHLPETLSDEDKTSLLKHFGAMRVRVMGTRGRMKHCAFAMFPDHIAAKKALARLHQLEVDERKLSVEYSKKQIQQFHPKVTEEYGLLHKADEPEKQQKVEKLIPVPQKVAMEINSLSSCWQMDYPMNPNLRYRYPAPTMTILTNIANALASVPKFYVQVLHLMNKMNLPAPFGPVTSTPPLADDITQPPLPTEPDITNEQDMEVSTSEESEIESDPEQPKPENPIPKLPRKRKNKNPMNMAPNFKMQKMMGNMIPSRAPGMAKKPEEVFEQPQGVTKKSSELKIHVPASVPVAPAKPVEQSVSESSNIFEEASKSKPEVLDQFNNVIKKYKNQEETDSEQLILEILNICEEKECDDDTDDRKVLDSALELLQKYGESIPSSSTVIVDFENMLLKYDKSEVVAEVGGFGKMEPIVKDPESEPDSDEEVEEWGSGKFISSRRLRKGKISRSEMKSLSVFKNYNPGEPTSRLYLKNIQSKTTEEDLHYVYGRYVDWENEAEKTAFDIRLMKEGRMKGQAFITLGSETRAKDAVDETNGFELNGKPLVVQFARSAKPKENKEGDKKDR